MATTPHEQDVKWNAIAPLEKDIEALRVGMLSIRDVAHEVAKKLETKD